MGNQNHLRTETFQRHIRSDQHYQYDILVKMKLPKNLERITNKEEKSSSHLFVLWSCARVHDLARRNRTNKFQIRKSEVLESSYSRARLTRGEGQLARFSENR